MRTSILSIATLLTLPITILADFHYGLVDYTITTATGRYAMILPASQTNCTAAYDFYPKGPFGFDVPTGYVQGIGCAFLLRFCSFSTIIPLAFCDPPSPFLSSSFPYSPILSSAFPSPPSPPSPLSSASPPSLLSSASPHLFASPSPIPTPHKLILIHNKLTPQSRHLRQRSKTQRYIRFLVYHISKHT